MKSLKFSNVLVSVLFVLGLSSVVLAQDAKFVIEGNDQMKFDVTKLEVRAGQKVQLTFKNVGKLPKVSMGHNVVFLKGGMDWNKFVADCATQVKNDYIDPARTEDILARTKLLGPGESETITFTAPEKDGSYDYVCTFPAHAIVGMHGVLIVR